MGSIFFTADFHFNHFNAISHSGRPYVTTEEMNKALIENHNSRVNTCDTVYYLGDILWKSKLEDFIPRLYGKEKHLILGNHDKRSIGEYSKFFNTVERLKEIRIENKHIVLCHYAMRTWNRSHYGSIQLHAHSHGTLPPIGKQYDVGVDNNNYYPVSWEEIKKIMCI
jgi:calcineurin-like phosphoesterase family protein